MPLPMHKPILYNDLYLENNRIPIWFIIITFIYKMFIYFYYISTYFVSSTIPSQSLTCILNVLFLAFSRSLLHLSSSCHLIVLGFCFLLSCQSTYTFVPVAHSFNAFESIIQLPFQVNLFIHKTCLFICDIFLFHLPVSFDVPFAQIDWHLLGLTLKVYNLSFPLTVLFVMCFVPRHKFA